MANKAKTGVGSKSPNKQKKKATKSQQSSFCLEVFNEYQDRISSFLLCKNDPLTAGPLAKDPDTVQQDNPSTVLSTSDAVFMGPNAFLCFLLIYEMSSKPSTAEITSSAICLQLNRHGSTGAQSIKRLLRMGVARGLLLQRSSSRNAKELYYDCADSLKQILQDSQKKISTKTAIKQPAKQERAPKNKPLYDAVSDDLLLQVKRVYVAHKKGQSDYVLEASAVALRALRSQHKADNPQVIDHKILLLSVRAIALQKARDNSASVACMQAAVKCMAMATARQNVLDNVT